MLFAILGGLLVLLIIGLVVAVSTAVQARRALEDLEDEFAERGGVAQGSEPSPWSAFDLALMRDEVVDTTQVTSDDPYATLIGPDEGATWHALGSETWEREPNGSESEPSGADLEPNGSKRRRTAGLAPIEDLSPYAWRASDDAPVIVLVVGAGFLGTGVTAGVTTPSRLRRVWGNVSSSFAEAGVTRHDADSEPASRPAPDPVPRRDHVATVDARSWSRPQRSRVDGARRPQAEDGEDSPTRPTPRSNPLEPKPSGDPRPIVWRAPTTSS